MFGSKQKFLGVHLIGLMSAFDAEAFASSSIAEANDTKFTPVPEGEYAAVIKKKAFRNLDEKGMLLLDITWGVDDAAAKEVTGMKEPTVRQTVFIDRNEQGALDMGKGKNVGLGKLREGIGLNAPGQPFNFNMLEGRAGRISVKHRTHEGSIFAEVKEVTKL